MKSPVEFEEAPIFKNVVLPKNYYTIDNQIDFVSTEKVRQICNDLGSALGGNVLSCGLIKLTNGLDYVGFYYYANKYVSITLGTYSQTIRLIGLENDVPYTYSMSAT